MKENWEEIYNMKEINKREHFKWNVHLVGLNVAEISNKMAKYAKK